MWRLISRIALDDSSLHSERLLRLSSSGELIIEIFPAKESESIWLEKEWGTDVDWVLLAPDGNITTTGVQAPKTEILSAAIESKGWKTRSDRCTEFLKEHPDSGEAWGESLRDAAWLLRSAEGRLKADADRPLPWWIWQAPPPDPLLVGLRDKARGEWIRALEGLRPQPDFWRWPSLAETLSLSPDAPPPSMQSPLRSVLADLQKELGRSPQSGRLWAAWSQVARRIPTEASEYTPTLFRVPQGEPWPPPAGQLAVLPMLKARGDLRSVVSWCRNQLLAPPSTAIFTETDWRNERLQRIRDWGLPGLEALVKLRAEGDGRVWLDDLHRLYGKDWEKSNLLAFLHRVDNDWLPTSWEQLIREEALPNPPLPPATENNHSLNLALDAKNEKALKLRWFNLISSPELESWDRSELRWDSLTPTTLKQVRENYGLDAKPRWFLFQGDRLLASGTSVPEPLELAQRLRAITPSRLEVLDVFLAQNPDQREARIERYELLRPRVNRFHPRLESRFLSDVESALLPVTPDGDWQPVGEAWEAAAKRVLARLEVHLRHWPSDIKAWETWITWSNIHPERPLAAALMAQVAAWGPNGLPDDVAYLGALQLKQRGEWKTLLAFTQPRWDAITAQAQAIHPSLSDLDESLTERLARWLTLLEEGHGALGQAASAKQLRQEYESLTKRKAPRTGR